MLAVVTAPSARLDAGSVGLALARRWSESGERVLFVEADPSGTRLAERLGEVENAQYSPAVRGMPSLIVARKPLTLGSLAGHCYDLDAAAGSLWALFAPYHPAGAELAARWLGDRVPELTALDTHRSVVVSSSLTVDAEPLAPVLWDSTVLAVVAPVGNTEDARELWGLCRDLKLSDLRCGHRVLIVEGESLASDDEIAAEAGMRVAGRLPAIDDSRVLRSLSGRRERAFAARIGRIAERLLAVSRSIAARTAAGRVVEQPPEAQFQALDQLQHDGVNGAESALAGQSDRLAETTVAEGVRDETAVDESLREVSG